MNLTKKDPGGQWQCQAALLPLSALPPWKIEYKFTFQICAILFFFPWYITDSPSANMTPNLFGQTHLSTTEPRNAKKEALQSVFAAVHRTL